MESAGRSSRGTEKRVLTAVTLSHLAQHFTVGVSVLYPQIMSDLTLSYTQLGIMTGSVRIIAGFLQMAWSLLNRYASRGLLLGVGNLLMSAGCFIVGRARGFVEFTLGEGVRGSGQAAQHPVGTSIITHTFPQERVPWALSIHYGLGYVGNILSPVLLSTISVLVDWRWATYLLAAVPLATGMTVLYALTRGVPVRGSQAGASRGALWTDVKSALRRRSVILVIAVQAFAVGGTGMGVIITYTPLFLNNALQVGILETSVIYSLAVLGGVLGTMLFGHLASRFGNLNVAAVVVGSCSTLILLLTLYGSFTLLLIPHLFLIGTTSFACSSLLQAHLASITTPAQRDVVLGLYFTVGFGLSSIWTALTGLLIDAFASFSPAWILRATLGGVAFALIVVATRLTRPSPEHA